MYAYQQQQQPYHHTSPSVSVSTSQQTWDGSRWVAAPVTTSSSYQTNWQQPQQQQAPPVATATTSTTTTTTPIPPNPVATYTSWYHTYTKQATAWKQHLSQQAAASPAAQHAQTTHRWLQYQADQSSRAAHHFHQHPGAVSAPFDLPVAPTEQQQPHNNNNNSSRSAATAAAQQQAQQQQRSFPSSLFPSQRQQQPQQQQQEDTPGSLKHYFDRCMKSVSSPGDKEAMKGLVQKEIQHALQQGVLHTKDWSLQPIPMLLQQSGRPEAASAQNPAQVPQLKAPSVHVQQGNNGYNKRELQHQQSQTKQNGMSYYGPSSSSTFQQQQQQPPVKKSKTNHFISSGSSNSIPKKKKKNHKNVQITNSGGDYYGPASSSSSPLNDSNEEQDFLALPMSSSSSHGGYDHKNKKLNKYKYQRKDSASGFNQSTLTMQDRARRFSGPGGIAEASGSGAGSSAAPGGFGLDDKYMGKGVIGGSGVLNEHDYERMTVKGKNLTLEKMYLRLTAPPRPEMVRPQHILEQHVTNLLALRREQQQSSKDGSDKTNLKKQRDYTWFCSQFKAVRQDCTVQRIQNSFAVKVYESHARIALEEGDLNEFNQCQTQLKELYPLLLNKKKKNQTATAADDIDTNDDGDDPVPNRIEFLAFRLIYYVFLTGNEKYSGGSSDLFQTILTLTPDERATRPIAHALAVRQAVADVDYHNFFRLLSACPMPGSYSLMTHMVPTIRHQALLRMCRAYRPTTLAVEFVLKELGFASTETMTAEEEEFGKQWLASCACVLTEDGTAINTKDSSAVLRESDMETKKSLI